MRKLFLVVWAVAALGCQKSSLPPAATLATKVDGVNKDITEINHMTDHMNKQFDLLERFTNHRANVEFLMRDCIRQTPEKRKALKCVARARALDEERATLLDDFTKLAEEK